MTDTRRIIHIDMDAFFASVEQRDHPELRGLPIAVGYDGPRGVVATASYEARPFGVHSAMPVVTAKRLCPQLKIVPGNYHRYKEVSAQMHEIFHEYTDIIEPISLDEAFLDVTVNKLGIPLAVDIAREIKQKIRERLQLTASAGISYCKLLAKIASDQRKPDGITTIHPDRAQAFLDQLRIERFWGVGPRTAEQMHRYGIFTGRDLREHSLRYLTDRFGKMGSVLYGFARGIDPRPVETSRIRKSVGCEQTFLQDLSRREEVDEALEGTIQELMRRLARILFNGTTLTLKVKHHDFTQHTRSITVNTPLLVLDKQGALDVEATSAVVRPLAQTLLDEVDFSDNPIRLLGLSVSNALHTDILSDPWVQLEFDFLP